MPLKRFYIGSQGPFFYDPAAPLPGSSVEQAPIVVEDFEGGALVIGFDAKGRLVEKEVEVDFSAIIELIEGLEGRIGDLEEGGGGGEVEVPVIILKGRVTIQPDEDVITVVPGEPVDMRKCEIFTTPRGALGTREYIADVTRTAFDIAVPLSAVRDEPVALSWMVLATSDAFYVVVDYYGIASTSFSYATVDASDLEDVLHGREHLTYILGPRSTGRLAPSVTYGTAGGYVGHSTPAFTYSTVEL